MTTNDILHKRKSIMTTPTMADTRTATLVQLIEVLEAKDIVTEINEHFSTITMKHIDKGEGKDAFLKTIQDCGKEYDKESLIIGATIATTMMMLANNLNVEKTEKDIGYLYG